jgi:hypothetical protein
MERAGCGVDRATPPDHRSNRMCRNIRTLFNFEPPATDEEIRASALQKPKKHAQRRASGSYRFAKPLVSYRLISIDNSRGEFFLH